MQQMASAHYEMYRARLEFESERDEALAPVSPEQFERFFDSLDAEAHGYWVDILKGKAISNLHFILTHPEQHGTGESMRETKLDL